MKEPPKLFGSPILIISSFIAFCCSSANGYDGSLFGTLLANDTFKNFFAVDNSGIEAGAYLPYRGDQRSNSPRDRDGHVPNW